MKRFKFGKNWEKFLRLASAERVAAAEKSLSSMLNVTSLESTSFLDVGSGSGLFSLAARNLGAAVRSFDYDPDSVQCTEKLKSIYRGDDPDWLISGGDILDSRFVAALGKYDVVYSWGVLHHTGAMWQAVNNAIELVAVDGLLFISLYNDQRWLSEYWRFVKRVYNSGLPGKAVAILVHAPYFFAGYAIKQLLRPGRRKRRGMDMWRDVIDWLGGYPFEVARPEEVLEFCRSQGLELIKMTTVDSRHGCNEFVFRRSRY